MAVSKSVFVFFPSFFSVPLIKFNIKKIYRSHRIQSFVSKDNAHKNGMIKWAHNIKNVIAYLGTDETRINAHISHTTGCLTSRFKLNFFRSCVLFFHSLFSLITFSVRYPNARTFRYLNMRQMFVVCFYTFVYISLLFKPHRRRKKNRKKYHQMNSLMNKIVSK